MTDIEILPAAWASRATTTPEAEVSADLLVPLKKRRSGMWTRAYLHRDFTYWATRNAANKFCHLLFVKNEQAPGTKQMHKGSV